MRQRSRTRAAMTTRTPQVGDVTVRDILHEWVHRDRDHLAQLTALTQRPVWPGMGNARRFSQPDA